MGKKVLHPYIISSLHPSSNTKKCHVHTKTAGEISSGRYKQPSTHDLKTQHNSGCIVPKLLTNPSEILKIAAPL